MRVLCHTPLALARGSAVQHWRTTRAAAWDCEAARQGIVIPFRVFTQAFERFPCWFSSWQEIQRGVADSDNGPGRIVLTDATGIVTKAHVERSVEGIFDSPMAARVGQHTHRTGRGIAKIITHLRYSGVAEDARGGDAGNTL